MQDLIRFAETRDPELRGQLAVRHLPLVKFVARKMSTSLPNHIELDDLVSWGCLGLLDSIEKFDPSRNTKFSTYAVTRIRGAILDGLQQMDWAPKQITSRVRHLRRVREQLTVAFGCEPTIDELATALQTTPAQVRQWLVDDSTTRIKTLEVQEAGSDSSGMRDLPEEALQDVAAEAAEIRGKVALAALQLSERERVVFLLYYEQGQTLRQIADRLGVSVSSATQTHTRLVESIRGRLAALGGHE